MGIYNSNFDFNKYRAFYAVAEFGNFSKAAEMINISQPAISYSVKELENQLGVKLFVRNGKRVELTDKGKKLFIYVQKAFNKIMIAERALGEDEHELTGSVRIALYSHISLFLLPDLIKKFSELHPKVSFDIYTSSSEESREKLRNKEIDFAILQYPVFLEESNYSEEIIFELDNCFYSNKKYYDMYIKERNNIVEYPLILPMRGYDDISALEESFKRRNIVIKTNYRIYSMELAKKFVLNDMGIGWGLKKSIEQELKDSIFYEIPIDFAIPTTKFSISYDEKYLSDTSLEFLNFLKENINKVI